MVNIFSQILEHDLSVWIENINCLKDNLDGHIKGTYAESTLRNILKKFMPSNLSISNGWIIDEHGNRSDERDILVYDKNLVPTFLFDAGVGIIPLASLLYDIQIKCSVTEKTLKSAFEKFDAKSPRNVILSVNGNNLLEQYLKVDKDALTVPRIKVLSSENDAYYFWDVQYKKYSDIFTRDNILESVAQSMNIKNLKVESPSITVNGLDLKDLETKNIKIYQWIKIKTKQNIKGFIVGFLNTLYQKNVSDYIVEAGESLIGNVVTRTFCDNENNILFSEQDLINGLPDKDSSFSCQIKDGKAIVSLNKDFGENHETKI